MLLMEQELLTLPEHMSSPPVFSGVPFTCSLVLCVCFVDRCLSFCTFFFLPLCCLFFFDIWILLTPLIYKGNNKITEHRAIFQKEKAKLISQQTDKIWRTENLENYNDPDLVQAFLKKKIVSLLIFFSYINCQFIFIRCIPVFVVLLIP